MVIDRCRFNRVMMSECFGDESLRSLGHQIIVSSGATMGTKDAILVWTRHMTLVRSRFLLYSFLQVQQSISFCCRYISYCKMLRADRWKAAVKVEE